MDFSRDGAVLREAEKRAIRREGQKRRSILLALPLLAFFLASRERIAISTASARVPSMAAAMTRRPLEAFSYSRSHRRALLAGHLVVAPRKEIFILAC